MTMHNLRTTTTTTQLITLPLEHARGVKMKVFDMYICSGCWKFKHNTNSYYHTLSLVQVIAKYVASFVFPISMSWL
jgi:hypothetical protein